MPHLMEPPPDQEPPELTPGEAFTVLLWVVAVVLAFIVLVTWLAQEMTRPW